MRPPPHVFISYSHAQKAELRALTDELDVLAAEGHLTYWADTALKPGDKWDDVIRAEVRRADVVVGLITTDWLKSPYVRTSELDGVKAGDQLFVGAVLEPCTWKRVKWLASLQVMFADAPLLDGDAKGRKRAWVELAEAIHDAAERAAEARGTTQSGETGRPRAALPEVVLRRVQVTNVRGVASATFEPSPEGADSQRWTVLLGDNGCGKTTILRAMALALLGRDAETVDGETASWMRRGTDFGAVTVSMQHDERSRLAGFSLRSDRVLPTGSGSGTFVYGYGASRGSVLGGPDREVSLDTATGRVASLFGLGHLIHGETWLRTQALAAEQDVDGKAGLRSRFEAIKTALVAVLPSVDTIDVRADAVWIEGRELERCRIDELSDGYASMLGWTLDLIARWLKDATDSGVQVDGAFNTTMTGVVLIDEVDLHLHPRWQLEVIALLRAAFPKMTFVATTHNPLTLQSTKPGEVFVLTREAGALRVEPHDVTPGLTAESLLTGAWFDLPTTLDAETRVLLQRRAALLASGQKSAELDRITAKLDERLPVTPRTPLETTAQSLIADALRVSGGAALDEASLATARATIKGWIAGPPVIRGS